MAKGIFATAMLALASATSFAQPSGTDGCAVLRQQVQDGVYAAATQFALARADLSGARSGGPSPARRQWCRNTVEVTTRAFVQALAALNMPVRWNEPMDPGDYCLSGDLSQCYPGPRRPGEPMLAPNRLAFVYDAWQGVQKAVVSQMPLGSASNVSVFTTASLRSALVSHLDAAVEGPLYLGYPGPDRNRRHW